MEGNKENRSFEEINLSKDDMDINTEGMDIEDNGDKKKSNIKLLVFLGIILIILLLNHKFGWSKYLSDGKNLEFLKKTVDDNIILALGIYIVLTIIGCVVLALPGITFALLAGMIFGPIEGTFACLIATTLGAMIAFLVGRYFLKDSIKPYLEKNKTLKKLLFSGNKKNDLMILMITRMVPIFPYNIQNFAYGITDISFFNYSLYTFIFMFPGVAFFTIGAAGISAGSDRWKYFTVAGILAVAVTLIGLLLKKKYVDVLEVDKDL